KGRNEVISYMHHFFTHFGVGETDVDLHCNNCTGQNKNYFMLWYGTWRVAHKLQSTLNIHFLIAGHTKFALDCGFGLIKQAYKRTRVSTLADIAKVSLFHLIENRRRKSVMCMKTNMLISIMVLLCTGSGKQLARKLPQHPTAGRTGRWHGVSQHV
ncbi:hypothetical protein XENOCAPTIV_023806, partial [Xenoophorus captivus]